jgi:hypothetical protein
MFPEMQQTTTIYMYTVTVSLSVRTMVVRNDGNERKITSQKWSLFTFIALTYDISYIS